jgi:hypothetical protein
MASGGLQTRTGEEKSKEEWKDRQHLVRVLRKLKLFFLDSRKNFRESGIFLSG